MRWIIRVAPEDGQLVPGRIRIPYDTSEAFSRNNRPKLLVREAVLRVSTRGFPELRSARGERHGPPEPGRLPSQLASIERANQGMERINTNMGTQSEG